MNKKALLKGVKFLSSRDGTDEVFINDGERTIPIDRQYHDTRELKRYHFEFDGNLTDVEKITIPAPEAPQVLLHFIKQSDDFVTDLNKITVNRVIIRSFTGELFEESKEYLNTPDSVGPWEFPNTILIHEIVSVSAELDLSAMGIPTIVSPGFYLRVVEYPDGTLRYPTLLDMTYEVGELKKIPKKYTEIPNYEASEEEEGHIQNRPFYFSQTQHDIVFQGPITFCEDGIDFNAYKDTDCDVLNKVLVLLDPNMTYICEIDEGENKRIFPVKMRKYQDDGPHGAQDLYIFGDRLEHPFCIVVTHEGVNDNHVWGIWTPKSAIIGTYTLTIKAPSLITNTSIPHWCVPYRISVPSAYRLVDYGKHFLQRLLQKGIRVLVTCQNYPDELELLKMEVESADDFRILLRTTDGLKYLQYEKGYNSAYQDMESYAPTNARPLGGRSFIPTPEKFFLKSPNGSLFSVSVSNDGVLQVKAD